MVRSFVIQILVPTTVRWYRPNAKRHCTSRQDCIGAMSIHHKKGPNGSVSTAVRKIDLMWRFVWRYCSLSRKSLSGWFSQASFGSTQMWLFVECSAHISLIKEFILISQYFPRSIAFISSTAWQFRIELINHSGLTGYTMIEMVWYRLTGETQSNQFIWLLQ